MRIAPTAHILLSIAVAYAVTGALALRVTVPPDYVSLIFPPAGIALGALLIFGPRAMFSILAGSMAVQVFASLQSGVSPLNWTLLAAPLGATAQAGAGLWMMHATIGREHLLDTPRSVIRFLVLVAPVGCLVNASVAVPTLLADGLLPPSEAVFSWWQWWLGDTLGVLLATPLMLALLGHPRDAWRPRARSIVFTLLLTCGLTALAFTQIQKTETQRVQSQFERDAEMVAGLVDKRLASQLEMLHAVERFAALSLGFSADDFRAFVSPMLERHSGTQNFTWNPLVSEIDRSAFEATIRFLRGTDFRILDRDETSPGRTTKAAPASEYLPILFVEPLRGNEAVVGLNPLSIPSAAQAIARTRSSHAPHASEGFTLTQEEAVQTGVVTYLAVRQNIGTAERVVGVVSSAFRMDDVLFETIREIEELAIELCLVDLDAAQDNRRLSGASGCDTREWLSRGFTLTVPVEFAARAWEIRLRATPEFLAARQTRAAWASLVVGLFATSVLVAFVLVTSGHSRRIERLVEARTTELATTTEDLREQQAALSRAQSIARMGSWEIDPASGQVRCSDGLRRLLAVPEQPQFALQQLLATVADDDRPQFERIIRRLGEEQGAIAIDCRTRESSPRIMHMLVESEPSASGDRHRLRGTVQDVTLARQAEADIQRLAHYDTLTGLPNRTLWLSHARAALQAAQRHGDTVAVLFLDLDQFKTVNDSLGHQVGDRLLAEIARRLSACIREEDVLARLGGDEFVTLLPRIGHAENAARVAGKMLGVLSRPVELEGHELRLSVSIGIALHPTDGNDVDTLLKHADTAMYSAKDAGRNNFQFFVPEMNRRALERLLLEGGIRRGIDREEFALQYQPQVDTKTGKVVGAEALLRWNSPDLGRIPPDRFIPVAEECGLIVPLGDFVLRHACRQQAVWRSRGHHDLLVAINISALQFRKRGFVDSVRNIIAETGADPQCIELEITESALMQPGEEMFDCLNALGALGLTLALDDFGTGYSSLAYLKRLPITRLKLDRSFVQDLPGDAEDAAIASAAISMARDLGIEVVAEGVETAAQRTYLAQRGCRIMQGYLFSPPLDVNDLEERVGNSRPART